MEQNTQFILGTIGIVVIGTLLIFFVIKSGKKKPAANLKAKELIKPSVKPMDPGEEIIEEVTAPPPVTSEAKEAPAPQFDQVPKGLLKELAPPPLPGIEFGQESLIEKRLREMEARIANLENGGSGNGNGNGHTPRKVWTDENREAFGKRMAEARAKKQEQPSAQS